MSEECEADCGVDTTTHVPPTRAIEGLSVQEAMQHLTGASHSIAQILAHVVFWQEWVQHRCQGGAELDPTKGSRWLASRPQQRMVRIAIAIRGRA